MTSSNEKKIKLSRKRSNVTRKINSHEPTAVKRDSNDQEIAEGGQTGLIHKNTKKI